MAWHLFVLRGVCWVHQKNLQVPLPSSQVTPPTPGRPTISPDTTSTLRCSNTPPPSCSTQPSHKFLRSVDFNSVAPVRRDAFVTVGVNVLLQLHGAAMMQHAGLHHSAGLHTAIPNQHLTASAMLSPTTSVTSANGMTSSNNALLVSNLGPFCSEQELKDLFNRLYSFPLF